MLVTHSDDDFSLRLSRFEIPYRFWNITQGKRSVYQWGNISGFEKLPQHGVIELLFGAVERRIPTSCSMKVDNSINLTIRGILPNRRSIAPNPS